MKKFFLSLIALTSCFVPSAYTYAHEVYVLDKETIENAVSAGSLNPFSAYHGNEHEFYFWAFVSFVVFSTVLCVSLFARFEKHVGPLFLKLKRFAQPMVRLTAGVTLIVFGWYGILYGPELPIRDLFAFAPDATRISLMLLGTMILLGVFARAAALMAIFIYLYAFGMVGWYLFAYTMHLGAYFLLAVLGNGVWSLTASGGTRLPHAVRRLIAALHPYTFPALRMTFGLSVMFAAFYAKFLHSELAVQVVIHYDLTRFFAFDPLFVVLGALIIEFIAGLMLFLGVAVRWTVLFLAFWLTLGHTFTSEAWWVHLILFGAGIAIFLHGYDKYCLEWKLLKRFKKNAPEPVL